MVRARRKHQKITKSKNPKINSGLVFKPPPTPAAPMFVTQTPGGELQIKLRVIEADRDKVVRRSVKVVEKGNSGKVRPLVWGTM